MGATGLRELRGSQLCAVVRRRDPCHARTPAAFDKWEHSASEIACDVFFDPIRKLGRLILFRHGDPRLLRAAIQESSARFERCDQGGETGAVEILLETTNTVLGI